MLMVTWLIRKGNIWGIIVVVIKSISLCKLPFHAPSAHAAEIKFNCLRGEDGGGWGQGIQRFENGMSRKM